MSPALALAAFVIFACAHADRNVSYSTPRLLPGRKFDPAYLRSGCLLKKGWFANGAVVASHACLHCTCVNSNLVCRRKACPPLPAIVPPNCMIKRDPCCSTLQCSDDVADNKRVDEETSEPTTISEHNLVCIEDGITYAIGSAMPSDVECKNCFCLNGFKRCLRPSCVRPPSQCVPLPTRGVCCPQRYYCAQRGFERKEFNCKVDGVTFTDGEQVRSKNNCTTCYCLHGAVECKGLRCAPTIKNCEPVIRPGECCASQYTCGRREAQISGAIINSPIDDLNIWGWNANLRAQEESRSNQQTTKNFLTELSYNTGTSTPTTSKTKKQLIYSHRHITKTTPVYQRSDMVLNRKSAVWVAKGKHKHRTQRVRGHRDYKVRHPILIPSLDASEIGSSNKVKRTVEEFAIPPIKKPFNDNDTIADDTQSHSTEGNLLTTETTEMASERTTEQPEGTIKIVINGTINCTAELSSTSLPLSIHLNDTDKIQIEAMPRVPIVNGVETQTYSPNDIITDRSVNGGFDENDTFTINVTSSLNANTKLNSNTTLKPATIAAAETNVLLDLSETANNSKKRKGVYDYDYNEPTLPPSLPNLKIIPFVAADAVVDDETSKEPLNYPILEREDKFPVYYPNNPKDNMFTKREDIYQPTQYPVFISKKEPVYNHGLGFPSNRFSVQNDLMHDYTVSTSLGTRVNEETSITKAPVSTSTFEVETPAVNLFSPPIETEGGFIPKGPGIVDEYYAVYPSTPSGPHVPHLTTSMQLDISKGKCVYDGGKHIQDGETIIMECRDCICAWGRLSCIPIVCQTPNGCDNLPATEQSVDRCCEYIVCHTKNKTTTTTFAPATANYNKINGSDSDIATDNLTITMDMANTYQITQTPETILSPLTNTTKVIKINNNETTKNQTAGTLTTTQSILYTTEALKMNTQLTTIAAAATTSSAPETITELITTTSTTKQRANDTEYEDDEEDGFSFGSVLKLLLSDTYETTTTKKPKTSKPYTTTTQPFKTTTRRPSTTVYSKYQPVSTGNLFKPLPEYPYIPPKMSPSSVNRIDHLVLGEATAIKRTTSRPITNKTTKRPIERQTERTDVDQVVTSGPRPPSLNINSHNGHGFIHVGIFKLAGCNIYGRMYRVGRIITELSTPCQECWCTEEGVQCKTLQC